jgi:hypothetical protein
VHELSQLRRETTDAASASRENVVGGLIAPSKGLGARVSKLIFGLFSISNIANQRCNLIGELGDLRNTIFPQEYRRILEVKRGALEGRCSTSRTSPLASKMIKAPKRQEKTAIKMQGVSPPSGNALVSLDNGGSQADPSFALKKPRRKRECLSQLIRNI